MSQSFGEAADLYDAIRPSYPADAVRWALEPLTSGRIADIGAGTGIMTRVLASLGFQPVAVEPDDRMRARLLAAAPGVEAVAGRAEAIPVPSASVDAAVAAQSYHWFDQARAHAELARVIRPGGGFAAIWNYRDESVDWVREYSRLADAFREPGGSDGYSTRVRERSFGDDFTPVQVAEFHHATRHTADSLVALVRSRSYYLVATPEQQAALTTAVSELAGTLPDEFDLPYITVVHRARRLG